MSFCERLVSIAWRRPGTVALAVGAAAYLACLVYQAVDEIRSKRFERRFHRIAGKSLGEELRWQEFKLRCSGTPAPSDDELAEFIAGSLAADRRAEVLEWAAVSRRVSDRLRMMVRAYEEVSRET